MDLVHDLWDQRISMKSFNASMDQTQIKSRKRFWAFFCPILISLDRPSISARWWLRSIGQKHCIISRICWVCSKQHYKVPFSKEKSVKGVNQSWHIHRYSGTPCTWAYSFCPPPLLISPLPILLLFTSFPFPHTASHSSAPTFFWSLPVGWLPQHLLSFWAGGSISQCTSQADTSSSAAGTAKWTGFSVPGRALIKSGGSVLDISQLPDQMLPLEVKFLVVGLLLEDPAFLSLYVNHKVHCYIVLNNCKDNGGMKRHTALSFGLVWALQGWQKRSPI